MEKDLNLLDSEENIQENFNKLDPSKYHILYFSYSLNFHNIWHSPLILTTSLVICLQNLILRFKNKFKQDHLKEDLTPQIHHVAHISRFPMDEDLGCVRPKIFEATTALGMCEHDLFDRLTAMEGTIIIETIDIRVDKISARLFELQYRGVPYSEIRAGNSVFNFAWLNKFIDRKTNGGFCSWLETLSLYVQRIDLSKILGKLADKIIPPDIYKANLGTKSLFYKS